MFRRAKLWLDAIPPDVLDEADRKGTVVGRLALTDDMGGPLCASVRPPIIKWSAPTGAPHPRDPENPHLTRSVNPHGRGWLLARHPGPDREGLVRLNGRAPLLDLHQPGLHQL